MDEETEDQEEVGGLRMPDQGDDSVADDDNENDVTNELNNGEVTNPVDEVKEDDIKKSKPDSIKPSVVSRFKAPADQESSTPQIIINNPASLPDTPKKPLQQVVYTSKKSVSKDKIGIGCLLEAIGIFVFFTTFFTIVGPLVGLALFACGYAIARQKRYACRNCGNSLAPESKICPSCSAVYVTGILQILGKFLRVLLLIGLFFFVYALATGKWEGIQKSAEDWIEDKWGGDESTADPNVNNDGQSDVTNEPEGELPEIEPTDLIAERDWTDIQGRTLTASLIDALKRPDGSYYGKFRRPDGSEFEYDVLKLSKPDRARIKNALIQAGRIQE
jgi:hypothetical protein